MLDKLKEQARENNINGYQVVFNLNGYAVRDYIIFLDNEKKRAVSYYLGNIEYPIVKVLNTLSYDDALSLLGVGYRMLYDEYSNANIGYTGVHSRLSGDNTPLAFNIPTVSDSTNLQYTPMYAIANLQGVGVIPKYTATENIDVNAMFEANKNRIQVDGSKVYVPVPINLVNTRTYPLLNKLTYGGNRTHIPAMGAVVEENGVQLKIVSDITILQPLTSEYTTRGTVTNYTTNVHFNALVEIDTKKMYNENVSLQGVINKVLGMCSKQIEVNNKNTKLEPSFVELQFEEDGRMVQLLGVALKSLDIFVSPYYNLIDLTKVRVTSITELDDFTVDEETYSMYMGVCHGITQLPYKEFAKYLVNRKEFTQYIKKATDKIFNASGFVVNTTANTLEGKTTLEVRFKNNLYKEDDYYLYFHNEIARYIKQPYIDRMLKKALSLTGLERMLRSSLNRKVNTIMNYSQEWLDITNTQLKVVQLTDKIAISLQIKYVVEKSQIYSDTKINDVIEEIYTTLNNKIKTMQ